MSIFSDIRLFKQHHPKFFWFSTLVVVLYFSQFILKTEITPLGYFSLYSNKMQEQKAYYQILPFDTIRQEPINIYQTNGTGFLMMEILPTRYEILANSDHCNQMNFRLQRLGLRDNNLYDCQNLKSFKDWMYLYAYRQGIDMRHAELRMLGFKNGVLIDNKPINDSSLFRK